MQSRQARFQRINRVAVHLSEVPRRDPPDDSPAFYAVRNEACCRRGGTGAINSAATGAGTGHSGVVAGAGAGEGEGLEEGSGIEMSVIVTSPLQKLGGGAPPPALLASAAPAAVASPATTTMSDDEKVGGTATHCLQLPPPTHTPPPPPPPPCLLPASIFTATIHPLPQQVAAPAAARCVHCPRPHSHHLHRCRSFMHCRNRSRSCSGSRRRTRGSWTSSSPGSTRGVCVLACLLACMRACECVCFLLTYHQLRIPAHLDAGEYVLGFRWDCESSAQVWQACADVTITAQS
jgi:hypothetical protein